MSEKVRLKALFYNVVMKYANKQILLFHDCYRLGTPKSKLSMSYDTSLLSKFLILFPENTLNVKFA